MKVNCRALGIRDIRVGWCGWGVSWFLPATDPFHRAGLHNFFVQESGIQMKLLGQIFELFWKPNVCADEEIVPGKVGACLSLRHLLPRPKWLHGLVPIVGP